MNGAMPSFATSPISSLEQSFWRRLGSLAFRVARRRRTRFGTILVSIPDASNDNVGDHTHDWGDDQRHQELAHGSGLSITEQRQPVLRVSLRGCPRRSVTQSDIASVVVLHRNVFSRVVRHERHRHKAHDSASSDINRNGITSLIRGK